MTARRAVLLPMLLLALLPGAAAAALPGTWTLDVRLRLEQVDDGAFARDATALTLRTRLGWRSGAWHGWSVLVEGEDVRALVDGYNSTANGRTGYPVVLDPQGAELNQAWLGWDGAAGNLVRIGRQRIALDNQRFIGNVGWRQNEQTFDAVSASWRPAPAWTLRWAWLDRVHRVAGRGHPQRLQARQDLDAHLVNVAWAGPLGTLTGYGYLLENQDLPAQSTRSLGLRHAGERALAEDLDLLHAAEWARQSGWRDAPDTGTVGYLALEAGVRRSGHALRAGGERLAGNGVRAFQTPLATGHAFNGWADRFLVTPADGLRDRYLKLDGPLGPLRYGVAWHDFRADRGGDRYGRELDLQLAWPVAPGWTVLAKYADYRSDGFGSDVRKGWLSVEYRR